MPSPSFVCEVYYKRTAASLLAAARRGTDCQLYISEHSAHFWLPFSPTFKPTPATENDGMGTMVSVSKSIAAHAVGRNW